MFDIITFGSASKDILVRPKHLTVLKYQKELGQNQELCFSVGSKIDVDQIQFSSGGGGTNTAAAFSLQGFKTAFYGAIGQDIAGREIIDELKKLKINTTFVFKTSKKPTNHSIIILNNNKDRTILAYRGASELLTKKDINWKNLKTRWFYLAPLTGLLCDRFGDIVDFANKNKIKIAINPSLAQLALNNFSDIVKKVDILFLNQEEASFLTKVSSERYEDIFQKLDDLCPSIVVMTKGVKGVVVSDGNYLYSAKPRPDRKIVDTTGAGDSFASGFISEFIRSSDIEKSVQLGMANSEGCLSKMGAKNGLLKKGQKFEKVEVIKKLCS